MSEKRTIDDASHDEWEQENRRLAKSQSAGATPEECDIKGVAAVAAGSASSRDITEDEEYQKFVESMVRYCHCSGQHRPCDGVLAGGLCDNIHDDPSDDEETSEERYDREVYGDEWHTPMSL